MKEKLIYDNDYSKLTVTFDGEIIGLIQEFEDLESREIFMYEYELDEILKFLKENNRRDKHEKI